MSDHPSHEHGKRQPVPAGLTPIENEGVRALACGAQAALHKRGLSDDAILELARAYALAGGPADDDELFVRWARKAPPSTDYRELGAHPRTRG